MLPPELEIHPAHRTWLFAKALERLRQNGCHGPVGDGWKQYGEEAPGTCGPGSEARESGYVETHDGSSSHIRNLPRQPARRGQIFSQDLRECRVKVALPSKRRRTQASPLTGQVNARKDWIETFQPLRQMAVAVPRIIRTESELDRCVVQLTEIARRRREFSHPALLFHVAPMVASIEIQQCIAVADDGLHGVSYDRSRRRRRPGSRFQEQVIDDEQRSSIDKQITYVPARNSLDGESSERWHELAVAEHGAMSESHIVPHDQIGGCSECCIRNDPDIDADTVSCPQRLEGQRETVLLGKPRPRVISHRERRRGWFRSSRRLPRCRRPYIQTLTWCTPVCGATSSNNVPRASRCLSGAKRAACECRAAAPRRPRSVSSPASRSSAAASSRT